MAPRGTVEDLATNPADNERHGIRAVESFPDEDDRIDELDGSGSVVDFVTLPGSTFSGNQLRRVDLWDDLMIASYWLGDALDPQG